MGFPLILGIIVSFLRLTTMSLAISMAKNGCSDKCGNITIPYPFGIGSACSANSSFIITCNNSVPILSSINVEVANISLNRGFMSVKQPISPISCSSEQKTLSLGIYLRGSPFYISDVYNSLVVLGCQNVVWLRANATSTIGGCMAICDTNSTDTSCNGVNCCKTSIPRGRQELNVTYKSVVAFGSNGSCGYTFLADHKWFLQGYKTHKRLHYNLSNPFDIEFKYANLTLEWKLSNHIFSRFATSQCFYRVASLSGQSYYNVYDEPSLRECSCREGFEGNPYLPEGCYDIDECSSNATRGNFCGQYTCINTVGSYRCLYPEDFRTSARPQKIIFIVIGSVFGILTLLFVGWKSSRVLRKRIKANRKRKFYKRNGGFLLEKHELSATDKGVEKIKLFSSKVLARATDHYNENRVLGRGGQGTVYKGMLTDGRIVAVKKSKMIDEVDIETFINEVVILSQINHRNVVKLLGCCLETEVPLLVYEFIPNGTLFQHIHEPNEEFPLTWEMRVRVATEVANSLSYLHSAASAPIYHRDIKSTNILLDEKYRAKVSDFGTSRSVSIDKTHLTTRVLGTFGYLDPEYFQSSQFTEKSDVYSFGVVMVELLTGEKAVSTIRADVGRSLARHFLHSMEEDRLFDIIDARVLKEGKKEQILAIAELSSKCLHLHGKKRPTMKEVAAKLEMIQNLKEGTVHQNDMVEENELRSIEKSEFYHFSSIRGSTNFDSIILSRSSSSDAQPLLVDET